MCATVRAWARPEVQRDSNVTVSRASFSAFVRASPIAPVCVHTSPTCLLSPAAVGDDRRCEEPFMLLW